MSSKYWLWVAVFSCVASAATARQSRVERKLVAIKAEAMSADYRADLPKLAVLRSRAAQLSSDPKLGYLADYWSGYASWRIVINGGKMAPAETKSHIDDAVADFESSIHKNADFADGYVGAAAAHGWLAALNRDNQTVMNQEVENFKRLLNRGLELDPSNPRAMWIQAIPFAILPPERGGNIDRAIELYHKMVESAAPLQPQSPLPDWGKVEGLMSLAYAELKKPSPDVDAAESNARAALRLQPDWHYLKDILLPQIEAHRK